MKFAQGRGEGIRVLIATDPANHSGVLRKRPCLAGCRGTAL